MDIYTIYKATNKTNGKCYIGFDSNWPKRQFEHKSSSKIKDYKFYRAIRKYGWDNFEWSILYQSKEKEHTLKVMEEHFIVENDSLRKGYNMTLGGEGNHGRILTESMRENYRQSKLGEKNPNYGKKLKRTESHCQSISKWQKEKVDHHAKKESICPYCNKVGSYIIMQRWHFSNCKFRY
jgi:group I intron endonuclease